MKIYKYIGKNLQGKMIRGLYKTDNIEELIAFLKDRDYFLVFHKEKKSRKKIKLFENRLTSESISFFSNQLKIVVGAGITMLQSLNILAMQCKNQLLRDDINTVIKEISEGESLYRSLEKCPYKFPLFFTNMVRVGEESGMLEVALSELSDYYYKEHKLEKKIKSDMAYPILVLAATMILSIFLLVKFIPSIASIILSINADVPKMTKIIINISLFVRNNGILLIVIIFIINLLVLVFMKRFKIIMKEASIIRFPIVGGIYKEAIEMKLSKILFMLIKSGVNLMKALEISSETINNQYVRKKLGEVISLIGKGHSLSEAMYKTTFFSEIMISFVSIGEASGKLELMLEKLSNIFEENLDSSISKLTERIKPIMLLILGAFIGCIILSMIIPVFDLTNAI